MSPEAAEFFRWTYAVLAGVCACGFAATLVIRWEELHYGERALRIGLVIEHLVIVYGAYVALSIPLPPTWVGLFLTISLVVLVLGFIVWFADDLLPRRRRRLHR